MRCTNSEKGASSRSSLPSLRPRTQALEPLQGDRSPAGEGRRRGALRISARLASRERAFTDESKSSPVSSCAPAKSLSRSIVLCVDEKKPDSGAGSNAAQPADEEGSW